MKKLLCLVLSFGMLLSGCGGKEPIVPAAVEPEPIHETISILTLGDNLLHMPVINSGKKADGSYDFSHLFTHLQPQIQNADLAVIGQETIFAGAEAEYSGYPLFNSPTDVGKTLVNEGFDVVLHASNHVLDKLSKGVHHTLDFWKNYPDIYVLGINESQEAQDKVTIAEVKGAKLALLNYTYGTNGIKMPDAEPYLVNYIDEAKMEQDALFAEEHADFTIAFMHWGTEYSMKPDSQQKALAQKLCAWGVDLIIGSHPHVIEPMEWVQSDNGNMALVYYSLGNFVSRQKEARNLLGAMADVKLSFDGERVSISDYAFVPVVTHYSYDLKEFAVYPLKEYTDALAQKHGIAQYDGAASVERWRQMIEKVFEGYDFSVVDLPSVSS